MTRLLHFLSSQQKAWTQLLQIHGSEDKQNTNDYNYYCRYCSNIQTSCFQKRYLFCANCCVKKAKIQSLHLKEHTASFSLLLSLFIIPFSARQCMNSRKNRLRCGLFSISAKQLHLLTSFSVEFIQQFWKKAPMYFSQQCFPTTLRFQSFYSTVSSKQPFPL